jgi:hypothetical protein
MVVMAGVAALLTPAALAAQPYGSGQPLEQPLQNLPSKPAIPQATEPVRELPPGKIASASVEDASGQMVGKVQLVKITTSGRVSSVDVRVIVPGDTGRVVSIKEQHLRYVPATGVLKTSLSLSEINALPSTQDL